MKKPFRRILQSTEAYLVARSNVTRFTVAITLVIVAIATTVSMLLLNVGIPPAQAQAGSPQFKNPDEVTYNAADKRLRMVMQLSSGRFSIPNVGTETLRQFRGWDASKPAPVMPTTATPVSPGPTLRARLGDTIQISFLNKINDSVFPYTRVVDSTPGQSDFGCDKSGVRDPQNKMVFPYPAADKFPNCFHGSSTANIHFHGTHTTPDGLGDNVLVQVMPQLDQQDWLATFNKMFDSGSIPQQWKDMPADYQSRQMELIQKYDEEEKKKAEQKKLPPPESLYDADQRMIKAGMWPQYLMGAFPNFFQIPDYDKDGFNSGNNGFKAGQAPGTHWYHAHKHGSTSLHIRNGLAGAFIIESSKAGGYDHVIRGYYGWDTYGNHEKIFVVQQFDPIQNLERTGRAGNPGKGGEMVFVNGMMTPTITMQPGEVQLWRFVNATEGNGPGIIKNTVFQTPGFKFKQTAMDGVQFSKYNYDNQPFLNPFAPNGMVPGGLTLAAGNRADLLVQAPMTPGTVEFKSGGLTLFFVNVQGTPVTPPAAGAFPQDWGTLPTFLNDLNKPGPNDAINQNSPLKFQWEDGRTAVGLARNPPGFPPNFMINGKQFNQMGEMVDQCMPQDGLQEWVLENYTTVAHPFHIHINPFQVIRIESPTGRDTYNMYAPPKDFVWQDVVAIPGAKITTNSSRQITSVTPGRVVIRQAYPDFTGTYVLHCHILAHEDRGMMQLVRVVKSADYPKRCQDDIPQHH